MMEAVREKWTDERLDDLSARVDDLGRRMDLRFDAVERRFLALEASFHRMQWTIVTGFLSLGGLIVTLAVVLAQG